MDIRCSGSGNNEIANEIVCLCETFLLIPRLSWFVEVCLQNGLETTLNLDLESVLTQLEVEFASAEEEYEVLGDQESVAAASDSDGEAEMTASVQI